MHEPGQETRPTDAPPRRKPTSLTSSLLRHGGGLAVAAGAGWLAYLLQLPLAWVLGPLLATSALSLAGITFDVHKAVRRAGQVTVGATVGLGISPDVVDSLLPLTPYIVGAALAAILTSTLLSAFLAHFARLDRKTAFFAMMPGGLAEMGTVGASLGARAEPIVLCQTLRVALVVCLVPPFLSLFLDADSLLSPNQAVISLELAAALIGAGALTAYIVARWRINAPWMIGSLVVTAAAAGTFDINGHMPSTIFRGAQILIGYAIGSRLDILYLLRSPRLTVWGALLIIVNMILLGLMALVLPAVAPLSPGSALLATSPGGMAEMITSAQAFHLSVATVTAFQAGRALIVNGFSSHYWSVFSRIGLIGLVHRLRRHLAGGDD